MKKKITITIEERILEEIEQHAKAENRTISNYIEQTIFTTYSKALQEIVMQLIDEDKRYQKSGAKINQKGEVHEKLKKVSVSPINIK